MIITRTPFRISFFGGGTDYPVWYEESGGIVLSTTINKYCYVMLRWLPPFFDFKYRIRYTFREEVKSVEEIKHPSVRECLKYTGIKQGIEMLHTSDIPARSGVGSSSAFTVGLLNALHALNGKMSTKRQLAREAIYVEQKILKENVGSQDQVAAAFGGLNVIEFGGDKEFHVTPVPLENGRRKLLQDHMLLFFTGFSRNASDIAAEQIKMTSTKKEELNQLKSIAIKAKESLCDADFDPTIFGKLLHESWMLKKGLTDKISNQEIDDMYKNAIDSGAIGGKLLGAGGGGFLLIFAEPKAHERIKERLSKLLYVPFAFENLGSQVVLYSTQDFY